ncbi:MULTISPECIES: hypothetical protein [Rufibacter]|uniref:Uncharacterized protein n=1 Tax=Rufibacter quisquiliarum TaxID=1549639 RepID=A0A839GWQ1_9BACT|nr:MULTISPECIES: hypothetical protein [Rufibacter]MBA9079885.1 hypothetical protein [Rufibacter quisquiliarum]
MRNIFKLFIAVLTVSCSSPRQEGESIPLAQETLKIPTVDTVQKLGTNKDNLSNLAANETPAEEEAPEECVFDQETQTDEFLKDVEELKGYKWDYGKRTATFLLETGDTLQIYRGGCSHFVVEAEFRLRNDKTDYSNWGNVYKKALWIAKVLDNEFDYKALKKDIDSKKVTFGRYEEVGIDVVYFTSEDLRDREYQIERKLESKLQTITLSYSII